MPATASSARPQCPTSISFLANRNDDLTQASMSMTSLTQPVVHKYKLTGDEMAIALSLYALLLYRLVSTADHSATDTNTLIVIDVKRTRNCQQATNATKVTWTCCIDQRRNSVVKLENVAITNALQLEGCARRRAPLVLGCFWPHLYCTCAQTAIPELPIKILTSPLDSATVIF